jgi:hypothetical protein
VDVVHGAPKGFLSWHPVSDLTTRDFAKNAFNPSWLANYNQWAL